MEPSDHRSAPVYASRGDAAVAFVVSSVVCYGVVSAYLLFRKNWVDNRLGGPGENFLFVLGLLAIAGLLCGFGYLVALRVFPRVPAFRSRRLYKLSAVLGLVVFPASITVVLLLAKTWLVDTPTTRVVDTSVLGFFDVVLGPTLFTWLLSWLALSMIQETGWLWPRTVHPVCYVCGYDLTMNTTGVCPECGKKVVPDRRWSRLMLVCGKKVVPDRRWSRLMLVCGIIVMFLVGVYIKIDGSTANESPVLAVAIKSIRPGPTGVWCELELTNRTDQPIRVGGFSLSSAIQDLKVRDASGKGWHVARYVGESLPPPVPVDFRRILLPHMPQMVTVYGEALVSNWGNKPYGVPTGSVPCRYTLDCDVEVSDVDIDYHTSWIHLKLEGGTVVR